MSNPSKRTSKEVELVTNNTTLQSLAADTAIHMIAGFSGNGGAIDYNFNMAKVAVSLKAISSSITRVQIKTILLTELVLTSGLISVGQVASSMDGVNNFAGFDGSMSSGELDHDNMIDQQRRVILRIKPRILFVFGPSGGSTYDIIVAWDYSGPPLRVGKKRDWTFSKEEGWKWSFFNFDQTAANDASWVIDGDIVATGKWFE